MAMSAGTLSQPLPMPRMALSYYVMTTTRRELLMRARIIVSVASLAQTISTKGRGIIFSNITMPNKAHHGSYLLEFSRNITTLIKVRVLRATTKARDYHVDDEGDSTEDDSWVEGMVMKSYICPTTLRLIYVV